jgi:hypothetical protein
MQVVIDIDEQHFELLQMAVMNGMGDNSQKIIAQGTPLPKGHGDLIDRKELLKQPMDKTNYPSNYVRIADAIIGEDKAESEE